MGEPPMRWLNLTAFFILFTAMTAMAKTVDGGEILFRCNEVTYKATLSIVDGDKYIDFHNSDLNRQCGRFAGEIGMGRPFISKYKSVNEVKIDVFFAPDFSVKKNQIVTAMCAERKFKAEILDISKSRDGTYVQLRYLDAQAENACGWGAYHYAVNAIDSI
jgi:hypothetical protein